jgi:hypothetical protein
LVEGQRVNGRKPEKRDRTDLRRAADRLLAWGFAPSAIAQQLGCSLSWVYAVRRERTARHADAEERDVPTDVLLHGMDSRAG